MYKNSISKLVPNHFNQNQSYEYIKTDKIKAQIREKCVREPLQERTNKLVSGKNQAIPVRVDLRILEEDGESGSGEVSNNDGVVGQGLEDNGHALQGQNKDKHKQKLQLQKQCTGKQVDMTKQIKNELNISKKSISKQKSRSRSKKKTLKPKKSLQQIFQDKKLNIVRTALAERNKKIFNLQLSDSQTQKQHVKQMQQHKHEDFKYIHNVNFRDNQLKNIFDPNIQPPQQNQKKKICKFQINVSDDDQDGGSGKENKMEQAKQNQNIVKPKERSKFILNNFDSDSEDQKLDDKTKSNQRIENDQQEEQFQVVRNMNILKLKTHFQYVKIDNNFLAFCQIPPERKTSLIVKRNTQKSQYIIFDNELVSQVMKIQKSIGGVYKFFMVKQGSSRDSKPEMVEVAKMKSNFLGTEFHCYAYREEDRKQKKQKYQCASIKYDVNILGLNGPRKVKIYAPGTPMPCTTDLLDTYENNPLLQPQIKVYQSKTPKWMPELNAYVLNLRGTASHSIDSTNQNKQHLIFGKKSKDIFNLEIKSPFSVLQGVAFAVSSFQRKLACQ